MADGFSIFAFGAVGKMYRREFVLLNTVKDLAFGAYD